MNKPYTAILLIFSFRIHAQNQKDSATYQLNEVEIVRYKSMNGIGRINGDYNGVLFTGKKN